MIDVKEREYFKEQALQCCNIYIKEGQPSLESKLNEYNFNEKLIIELLAQVYIDVKLMNISHEEGKYRQNSILGVVKFEEMEE